MNHIERAVTSEPALSGWDELVLGVDTHTQLHQNQHEDCHEDALCQKRQLKPLPKPQQPQVVASYEHSNGMGTQHCMESNREQSKDWMPDSWRWRRLYLTSNSVWKQAHDGSSSDETAWMNQNCWKWNIHPHTHARTSTYCFSFSFFSYTLQGWGWSSDGKTLDQHAADADLIPWCGKEF